MSGLLINPCPYLFALYLVGRAAVPLDHPRRPRNLLASRLAGACIIRFPSARLFMNQARSFGEEPI